MPASRREDVSGALRSAHDRRSGHRRGVPEADDRLCHLPLPSSPRRPHPLPRKARRTTRHTMESTRRMPGRSATVVDRNRGFGHVFQKPRTRPASPNGSSRPKWAEHAGGSSDGDRQSLFYGGGGAEAKGKPGRRTRITPAESASYGVPGVRSGRIEGAGYLRRGRGAEGKDLAATTRRLCHRHRPCRLAEQEMGPYARATLW